MKAGIKRAAATKALLSVVIPAGAGQLREAGASLCVDLSRSDYYGVVTSHQDILQERRSEFLEAYQSVSRLAARGLSEERETMLKELETISGRGQISQKQKGDDA
jgi:hypothetical protein